MITTNLSPGHRPAQRLEFVDWRQESAPYNLLRTAALGGMSTALVAARAATCSPRRSRNNRPPSCLRRPGHSQHRTGSSPSRALPRRVACSAVTTDASLWDGAGLLATTSMSVLTGETPCRNCCQSIAARISSALSSVHAHTGTHTRKHQPNQIGGKYALAGIPCEISLHETVMQDVGNQSREGGTQLVMMRKKPIMLLDDVCGP